MGDVNNTTYATEFYDSGNYYQHYVKTGFIIRVTTYVIITIGLLLILLTIFALYFLVRKDHVTPIYVINLLITDLFQFCCLIFFNTKGSWIFGIVGSIVYYTYYCLLVTSVGFMVCISLERYLVIAHPLWYRFRRTTKISVAVCAVVWVVPPVFFIPVVYLLGLEVQGIIFSISLIVPFPLFIFFLVGTLRALSASVSVPSEEKRRIVGILVLVLLIYTLLFLPSIIYYLAQGSGSFDLSNLSSMFIRLSPLADLSLYVFIRKDISSKFLAAVCCCKMESNANDEPAVKVDDV
ncbi:G-protein coupled receptor 4-like [Halichoeres trimaculatus]|uniref:G-protein coupled receptor 4-like n=1 Tax=Halichoeres trimaculatus TaxID=147232 RepID=UPI003D9E44F8